MTWFELPPPAELGEGWSLRFLTAGQMLECRAQGEALAGEERDKGLWASAQLLSQVLLKDGEPPFEDGPAVLATLTAGQIDGLTRRWWEQDDFSRPARPEEWTAREGSENQHFDMARFLALGGEDPARGRGREAAENRGGAPFRVWPGLDLPRIWQRGETPDQVPLPTRSGGAAPEEVPRDRSARREAGEETFREEHRLVKLPEPEAAPAGPGFTAEELDRAVERDARRYDGALPLY